MTLANCIERHIVKEVIQVREPEHLHVQSSMAHLLSGVRTTAPLMPEHIRHK